ncbi:hypothetical protein CWC17_04890 [Pseudoalteromonas sp. S3785]|nr:hypothetical protein CWC17_04890 [Pseudoalteromonas sp. S3785]
MSAHFTLRWIIKQAGFLGFYKSSYQDDINMYPLYIKEQNYDKCIGFVCRCKACLRKKRSF